MLNLTETKKYVKENWKAVSEKFGYDNIEFDETDELCQYVLDQYLIEEVSKATEEEIKNLDKETINYLLELEDIYELSSEESTIVIPAIVWDMAHKYNELEYNGCIVNII